MTPVLAIATIFFAILGGWGFALASAGLTLVGAHGLWRERRLRIARERNIEDE